MSRAVLARCAGMAALALASGCFSPNPPQGQPCGPGDACPPGQDCYEGICSSEPPPDSGPGVDPDLEPVALQLFADAGGPDLTVIDVLEPNVEVVLAPAWQRTGGDTEIQGTLDSLMAPPNHSSEILKPTAQYSFSSGDSSSCDPKTQCYSIRIDAQAGEVGHRDAIAVERLGDGTTHEWTLHLGPTFLDVDGELEPTYYRAVEILRHRDVLVGCSNGNFCPDAPIKRRLFARWVAIVMAGAEAIPTEGTITRDAVELPYACQPNGTSLFDDVDPEDAECAHIHYLAAKGVASGCTNEFTESSFCPDRNATRGQAAAFVAKAVADGPVPETYEDERTGRRYDCASTQPADLQFTDVLPGSVFCAAIHYLWALGIDEPCGTADTFCPGDDAARKVVVALLAGGFQLELYEP